MKNEIQKQHITDVPITSFSMNPAITPQGLLPSRTKFCPEEDRRLRELVDQYGTNDWAKIALALGGRTARQCRERYKNFLQPSLVNGPWTPEEDELLIRLYHHYGPNWVAMHRIHFPTRSNNNIKNHWAILAPQLMKMTSHLRNAGILEAPADRKPLPIPIFNLPPEPKRNEIAERYSIRALLW